MYIVSEIPQIFLSRCSMNRDYKKHFVMAKAVAAIFIHSTLYIPRSHTMCECAVKWRPM